MMNVFQKNQTVLTVDDSLSVRKIIAGMLETIGYDVLEASNGLDALNKLAENKVDAIISDINMPEMNGMDMIKEIRKTDKNNNIPILMFTSESQNDLKQKAKDLGAIGWLQKPFNENSLIVALHRMLG